MGVAVTLLFYFIQKFNNTQEVMLNTLERQQESLKNVFTLGKELSEDSELAGIIGSIVADYQVVKNRNSPLFKQKMLDALQKCQGTLHNLAAGELSSEDFGLFSYMLIAIDQTRDSIKFVLSSDPRSMLGNIGKRYLELQTRAINRGVHILGIWLLPKEDLIRYQEVITAETSADLQVFVVEKEDIPAEFSNDYAVIDGVMLITTVQKGSQLIENISINEDKVKRAEKNFDSLLNYAVSASEYYGSHHQ